MARQSATMFRILQDTANVSNPGGMKNADMAAASGKLLFESIDGYSKLSSPTGISPA